MRIHAFIIGWTGKEEACKEIFQSICDSVDRVTIVYSTKEDADFKINAELCRTPDEWFYGLKFKKCLDLFEGEFMIQIQADAILDPADWVVCISRLKEILNNFKNVGVWAPDVDYTPFSGDLVVISTTGMSLVSEVMQTDGIVWGVSAKVVNRLKELDYSENNLGWGMDWFAISNSYANRLLVLRDFGVKVEHLKGSGYSGQAAQDQMNAFVRQMQPSESVIYELFVKLIRLRAESLASSKLKSIDLCRMLAFRVKNKFLNYYA